jgi:hypothetical protein
MMTPHTAMNEASLRGEASRGWAFLTLALLSLLLVALRGHLIDIPLERDEGGFAYVGRLILDGVPPYVQAYDYKPPGLYLQYALFISLFGGGAAGIHTGLLLMSVGTMTLLFFLVGRWSDTTGAAVAAFLAMILMLSPSVLGFAAHATQFVVFWAVLGWLLLEQSIERGIRWKTLASGVAFGTATLMKQPGALFFLPALILPFASRKARGWTVRDSLRTAAFLIAGFALPLLGTVTWLAANGAFGKFLYWTVEYPSMVAGEAGMTALIPRLFRNGLQAAGNFLPVWLAAVASFLYLMTGHERRRSRTVLALFFSFSAASLLVGYETRPHYFVLLLPALAAVTGVAVSRIGARVGKGVPRLLVVSVPCALAILGLVRDREYFFTLPPAVISRSIYAPNQFEDMGQVSDFIRSETTDTDRVAILGSEPELLFLSGRRSASRYIFTNFFHEQQRMRERMERDMIREIDSTAPAVIVMINQPFSWGAMPRKDWTILGWVTEYIRGRYLLAGTVTPSEGGASRFRWGEDAREDPGAAGAPIVIYRRTGGTSMPPAPGH